LLILALVWSVNNRPPKIDMPPHVMPVPNALDDFHRAYLLARKMKHLSPYSMPLPPAQANTDANFAACAADAAPVRAAIRQGLQHPFMAPMRSISLGYYPEDRELARIIAGVAEYYRRTGRYGESMRVLLDGLRMGAKLPRGDLVIGFLVACAVDAICIGHVEELIPRLSSAELKLAADTLEKIAADRVPMSEIIRNEGYYSAAEWANMSKDPKTDPNRLSWSYFEDHRFLVGVEDGAPLPWRARMKLVQFGLANKQKIIRDNLAYHLAFARETDEHPYTPNPKTPKPDNLIMGISGDLLPSVWRSYTTSQAALAILRTEVALEQFRKEHCRYPEALSALSPSYLTALPDDPFAGARGKPLHYLPAADGNKYLLYSVGGDMQDDGGRPLQFYNQRASGDIVAGRLSRRRRTSK
jgi:hypothetical protein